MHIDEAIPRIALDIGSTVIKVAWLDEAGGLIDQKFFPRDFDAGIQRQVGVIFDGLGIDLQIEPVLACSSANGGLRVGIVCASKRFSGSTMRNQVLLAGANPEYLHDLDETAGDSRRVDILLVGGGIDDEDAAPVARRLQAFDPGLYRYGTLVYAGNRFLAESFAQRFDRVVVIDNPQGGTLSSRVGSVFETVRRAYLDDLVFKEGVSELPAGLARRIRPTPEVASRGFLRSVLGQTNFTIVGACLALDIGGATTDLHYTVELVDADSPVRPATGVSVGRYVFTDLGIVASRDTLLMQLRALPSLFEFLGAAQDGDVRELYAGIRDGDIQPSAELLSYACLYLALGRFAKGRGPGLPTGDLSGLAQVILTGGAAQHLDESVISRIVALLLESGTQSPLVQIDRRYEIWVAGITWDEAAA